MWSYLFISLILKGLFMRDLGDFNITDASRGAAFTVRIVPKANRTEIVGIQEDGTIKIRLMAPPVEGEANEELIHFLAEFLGVKDSEVEILAGANSRKKLITVLNISSDAVEEKVRAAAGTDGFLPNNDDEWLTLCNQGSTGGKSMRRLVLMGAALGIVAAVAASCSGQQAATPVMLMTLPPIGTPPQATLIPQITSTPGANAGSPAAAVETPVDGQPDAINMIAVATNALAQVLGIPTTEITFVSSIPGEWNDSSLGCPEPGQTYAQVITPGYIIILAVGPTNYEVHTDLSGTAVVCTGSEGTDGGILTDPIVEEFIAEAKAELAEELGIDEAEIALVRSEAMDWQDTSLGCARSGQTYDPIITPGYRIILAVGENRYEYHTDQQRKIRCNIPTE
jgi:uncharacterized protein (TIGR00251 family)